MPDGCCTSSSTMPCAFSPGPIELGRRTESSRQVKLANVSGLAFDEMPSGEMALNIQGDISKVVIKASGAAISGEVWTVTSNATNRPFSAGSANSSVHWTSEVMLLTEKLTSRTPFPSMMPALSPISFTKFPRGDRTGPPGSAGGCSGGAALGSTVSGVAVGEVVGEGKEVGVVVGDGLSALGAVVEVEEAEEVGPAPGEVSLTGVFSPVQAVVSSITAMKVGASFTIVLIPLERHEES